MNLHARTLELSSSVHTRAFRVATLSRILFPPKPAPLTSTPASPTHSPYSTPAAHTDGQGRVRSPRGGGRGRARQVLVFTHLYGIVHGGVMELGQWEVRYK